MKPLARSIATLGMVGYARPAPGTWGSLVALPLAGGVHSIAGFPALLWGVVGVTLLGWWAVREAAEGMEDPDASEFVIDEVAGQWIALLPVSASAWWLGIDPLRLWPGILAAFLLFRLFDIWKPGPIGWADRLGTPWGVMLDDLIAGAFAAVGVLLLALAAHGAMGW